MTSNDILVYASCYFQDDPQKWAAELARVGKEEGYAYIEPTVVMLEDCHPGNKEVMQRLTLLRQPEWEWRSCENDDRIRFFGIPEDGKFVARGWYVTGRYETGDVKILRDFDDTANYTVGPDILKDPRDAYEVRKLKAKVWKKNKNYFLVLAGRVIDLAKEGFRRTEIKETQGRGYFGKFPAFAVLYGPMTKEEAQASKEAL